MRYLYEPGELEGQQHGGERGRQPIDPICSVGVYKIKDRYIKEYQPTLYYLHGGSKGSFVLKSFNPFRIHNYLISYLI